MSGKTDYKFNPTGFCTDMAGANFAAITKVFGDEMKSSIKSCEFHFKEQRNKRANRLDRDDSMVFKDICERLLTSTTEQAYYSTKKEIDDFIQKDEGRKFIKSWISWWHDRRGFIFRPFAPKDAPQINQAEVVHASWVHRDSPNLSLLDACQADVRDSIILDVELKEYERGSLSVGTGPSYNDRKKRSHAREVEKAQRMGRELLEQDRDNGFLIDPASSHKPSKKITKGRSSSRKPKQPARKTVPPPDGIPSMSHSNNYGDW